MNYYYQDAAQQVVGPVSGEELHAFHAAGLLTDETLVRVENAETWGPYRQIFGKAVKQVAVKRSRHILAVAGGIVALAGLFYGGSSVMDALVNDTPSAQDLRRELETMPGEFRQFGIHRINRTTLTGTKGQAEIELKFNETFWVLEKPEHLVEPEDAAVQAYEDAVRRARQLPADMVAKLPQAVLPSVYRLVRREGELVSINVGFTAEKARRTWNLQDCLTAWAGRRAWRVSQITWPEAPEETSGLHAHSTLPRSALLLGDKASEQALRDYVGKRRDFIAAVATAEGNVRWKRLEREVARVATATVAPQLFATHEDVQEVVLERPAAVPAKGAPVEIAGKLIVTQTTNLYRRAQRQPDDWEEMRAYRQALQVALAQFPNLARQALPERVVYELARGKGARRTESFRITVREEGDKIVMKAIERSAAPASGEGLVTAAQAGANAIFTGGEERTRPATATTDKKPNRLGGEHQMRETKVLVQKGVWSEPIPRENFVSVDKVTGHKVRYNLTGKVVDWPMGASLTVPASAHTLEIMSTDVAFYVLVKKPVEQDAQAGANAIAIGGEERALPTTATYRNEMQKFVAAVESRQAVEQTLARRREQEWRDFVNRYAGVWRGYVGDTANNLGAVGGPSARFTLTVERDLRRAEYLYEDYKYKMELTPRREGDALVMESSKPRVTLRLEASKDGSRAKVKTKVVRADGQWAEGEGTFLRIERQVDVRTTPRPVGPASNTRVIRVTGNDAMKYNLSTIEVAVGEVVEINFTNTGTMPKQAMGHNFVVLKAGSDAGAFSLAAALARATDYIPAELKDQVIAHTRMLGPKESDSIILKFDQAGYYPFLCSFPAHFQVGMKGVIYVSR